LLLYLALIIVFIIINFLGTNSFRKVFIDGDGRGHYAYLTSLLIYHSVDFDDVFRFEKQNRPPDFMGHYYHEIDDTLINKYTAGTALLQLPFFLLGFLLSFIFGFPQDGYNVIFQYCVALSTLFWVGIGLIYFVKLLGTYNIKQKYAWLMAIVGLFGTNLFYYTFIQPSFSHAYSFSLITIFLYFSRMVFIDYKKRYVLLASFLLGLIVLVRPINIIVIASLPFIAETSQNFFDAIKRKVSNHDYFPAVLIFLLAISPQLIINYLQTGNIIIYGYKNEGFYFSDPQIINFLFSYKKGWLIYSPLFLLLLPAIIYLWRHRSKYVSITFLLFLVVQVYIFSSWWNWYYGDSFGMRPMVDYYGLFLLAIALLLYNIKIQWIKVVMAFFVFLVVLLNVVQSYQYAVGIIHPDSMSKNGYWYVFLKTDRKYKQAIAGGDETYYGKLNEKPFFTTHNQIENFDEGWTIPQNFNNKVASSDSLSVTQNYNSNYSPSFKIYISDTLTGYNNIYVRFKTSYYEMEQNTAKNAVFVVDISDAVGNAVFYKTFPIKQLPDNLVNMWQIGSIGFKLPEITQNMSYIKFYVWNVKKQTYLLDDLSLELYTYDNY